MIFKKYYIEGSNRKSNCIIRTFCKLFCKSYDAMHNEMENFAYKLGFNSFAEIEVFEKYLNDNGFFPDNIDYNDTKIKDLDFEKGRCVVFCWDKKDYYHMLPIINGTVYDKEENSLNLYILKIYKE